MVEAHRVAADLPATNPLALLIGGRNPAHRRRAAALGAGILVAITAAIAAVAMAGWQGQVPVVGEDPSGVPVPALPYIVPADVLDLLTVGALARPDREPALRATPATRDSSLISSCRSLVGSNRARPPTESL